MGQAEVDAALAAAAQAPASGTTEALKFIGFGSEEPDAEYQVPGNIVGPQDKAPRYFIGAELMPSRENWEPIKTRRLQHQLVQAGLLDEDYYDGVWDPPSQKAFNEVLALANQTGQEWSGALENYMRQRPMTKDPVTGQWGPKKMAGKGASAQRERAPLVVRFTNPNDISATVNEVAEKRLGRRFTQDELNKFVTNYQAMERGAQTQEYKAGPGGGSVVANPSIETAANTAAEAADPIAATSRNMLPLIEGVNELMNGLNFRAVQPGG